MVILYVKGQARRIPKNTIGKKTEVNYLGASPRGIYRKQTFNFEASLRVLYPLAVPIKEDCLNYGFYNPLSTLPMLRFKLSIFITVLILGQYLYSQDMGTSQGKKSNSPTKRDSKISTVRQKKEIGYDGQDGPYIFNDTLYRVNAANRFLKEPYTNQDSLSIHVFNKACDTFHVGLKSKHRVFESSFPQPEKMVVISDIEGNYNGFASFLIAHKVIDERHNWIFGNGHLVLLGDFVDRGKNVTQVLWLIYKLERQAYLEKGHVHFILGNHEILNFNGNHTYNNGKYIKVAQEISGKEDKIEAVKFLYSNQVELGKWLSTKNVIEKIGPYLFVHGGLSPEILDYGLSLEEINAIMRAGYYKNNDEYDKIDEFLFGSKGPLWYRGLVKSTKRYDKIETLELSDVLSYYDATKIVVGHTFVKKISTGYGGKVIMTDVPHGNFKYSGKTKGLLIAKEIEYVIDDLGNRMILE